MKLKPDTTITYGIDNIDSPIKLGGNKGENHIETDDLIVGRRRKCLRGHGTRIVGKPKVNVNNASYRKSKGKGRTKTVTKQSNCFSKLNG